MKRHCYIVILILLLLLFGCGTSKYDTLNFGSHETDIVLDDPLNLQVQDGNSQIAIWWDYPKNQTISVLFSVYRSESENDEFKLLADDISTLYYYDTSVEPGKVYYYKVRAKSILYGESNFSEIKSGKRNGRGVDDYDKDGGNDKKEKSTRIELGVLYKSSLYNATDDDVDYYTLDAKKGDALEITIKAPAVEDSDSAALLYYDIAIYSDSETPIVSAAGRTLTSNGSSYLIFFTRDTPVYICISPDSTPTAFNRTGDYDLIVANVDSSKLFIAYSSNNISYVKISWSSYFSSMASKYIVQRCIEGTEDWEEIKGALSPYRLDVQSEFSQNVMQMYDRSAEVGVAYQYRVGACLKASSQTGDSDEVRFYSSVVNAKRYEIQKNVLPADSADNTCFDNALKIEPNTEKPIEGAIDSTDCRYYKVALEANKNYSFSIIPDSSFGSLLFSVDFFCGKENSDKNRIICIKPEEATSNYGFFSYTVGDAAGDYWLRIDGNNTMGKYSITVKEADS